MNKWPGFSVQLPSVKNYILDTNVLLHDPNSILSFQENNVLIPIEVIEPEHERLSDIIGAPMMSGCELWLKTRYGDEERLSAASIRSRRLSS